MYVKVVCLDYFFIDCVNCGYHVFIKACLMAGSML